MGYALKIHQKLNHSVCTILQTKAKFIVEASPL